MSIKISVIVPVYNVEEYLNKCIDSLLNQTLKDIEFIFVNDGSTDDSLNILKSYASKDDRIKIITQNHFSSIYDNETGVDIFSKINFSYTNAMATANVGIGVKKEGDLVISGTKGYIYVPAPWWKTEYFELRFEDLSEVQKFFVKFSGDGLRYELADFLQAVHSRKSSYKFKKEYSTCIAGIIEKFLQHQF